MKKFEAFEILKEDEEVSFHEQEDAFQDGEATCQNEVIILGGKLLCSDVFSVMGKVDQLHHVEIQTVMDKFTDQWKGEKHSLVEKKSTKSRLFGHEQKQKKRREHFTHKPLSFEDRKNPRSGSAVSNGELNELSVLTENLDSLVSNDCIKTRFPPILQANKEIKVALKRKQGTEKLQTATKEFLPSLNVKATLNEKNAKRSQINHLPSLIYKQSLTTKPPLPSPESSSDSYSSTQCPENPPSVLSDAVSVFSDVSPIIPRKKTPKSYGLSDAVVESPPSPRRPTPFPSIWGEDRFFMVGVGNNVMNEKAKAYLVKEESEYGLENNLQDQFKG